MNDSISSWAVPSRDIQQPQARRLVRHPTAPAFHASTSTLSNLGPRPSTGHLARRTDQDDYFGVKRAVPSPTSSLAADLSQNFHLGASPAVPTPRRSLMAQFSYTNGDLRRSGLTTPGEDGDTSMSPGEMMDTSPVPPRLGLSRTTSMFEPAKAAADHVFAVPRKTLRPALVSRSAFSSRDGRPQSPRDNKENELAALFEDSPKKTPRKFFGLGFSRKDSATDDVDRSPLGPIAANRVANRAVPQFRRTQSMITSNEEFLGPAKTHSSPKVEVETQPTILPSFESRQDRIRRISGETLAQVLDGHYRCSYDKLEIVDCRFPHEFEGGHVPNAVNISSLEALDRHPLLRDPQPHRTLLILHCEFSAHRAPRIALHLRSRDRELNAHQYPKLHYPEMYILQGGYSAFHRDFAHHASGYVEMNDPTHKPNAAKQMHSFRKNGKFQRTQSYTFGQDSPTMMTGGHRMERESNFRLAGGPGVGARQDPLIAAAAMALHQRPLSPERAASAAPILGAFDKPLPAEPMTSEESEGDTSMMDLDDVVSPVPVYQNTANNTLHRGHARTQSGRLDMRRLTSF